MNFIDWIYEVAPLIGAIGGFVGGLGALIAAILLFLTLRETRKQTKLGYEGFLGIVLDSHIEYIRERKSLDSPLKRLKMQYMFVETNRAPLLLKKTDFRFSKDSVINVNEWYESLKKDSNIEKKLKSPVVLGTKYNLFYDSPSEEIKDYYTKVVKNDRSAHVDSAVHAIIQYENFVREKTWVYVRWRFYQIVFENEKGLQFGGSVVQEEYRFLK